MFVAVRATMTICAAFGGEGFFDLRHSCAEVFQHMPNYGVVLYQQPIGFDLTGRVAIADVPSQLYQIAGDLQQRFFSGAYLR